MLNTVTTFREENTTTPMSSSPISRKEFFPSVLCKCKNWMCAGCHSYQADRIIHKLKENLELFQDPTLLTITVERRQGECPEVVHGRITAGRFIPRLLTKELGIANWIWFLEPQEESDAGWPHWHILLDRSCLPSLWYHAETGETQSRKPKDTRGWSFIRHFVDLTKANRLLAKWGIGSCKLSIMRERLCSPMHAVNSIAAYVSKMPERGYPPWMLRQVKLRMFGASRSVSSVLGSGQSLSRCHRSAPPPQQRRPYNPPRAPHQIIAACQHKVSFLNQRQHEEGHEYLAPVLTLPEWVEKNPAISVQECLSPTGKTYRMPGFTSRRQMTAFQQELRSIPNHWLIPPLACHEASPHEQVQLRIRQREQGLLRQWNKHEDPKPQNRFLASTVVSPVPAASRSNAD